MKYKTNSITEEILKSLKRVNGQSLAEFAVTTAMMATLATAAPKLWCCEGAEKDISRH